MPLTSFLLNASLNIRVVLLFEVRTNACFDLSVDDEQNLLELLITVLGKRGFKVKTALNGHRGFKITRPGVFSTRFA